MEFEKLQEIIADVLGIEKDEITMETDFQTDLGADSLDRYSIVMGIEDAFDIEIPEDAITGIATVGDAVKAIRQAR